jgi:hypothetical protein
MARNDKSGVSASGLQQAESLVVPVYRPKDIVKQPLLIDSWEFLVSENGGEYVRIDGHFANTGLPFQCSSYDKAIVAQLGGASPDLPRPVSTSVQPFGLYYKLA